MLDGSAIAWDKFGGEAIVEILVLFAILVFALFYVEKSYKLLFYILIVLGVMQWVDGAASRTSNLEPDLNNLFVPDEDQKFVFGKDHNIIIIILDAFQGSVFNEIISETPNYAEIFEGFTWFKNASVAIPSTKLSLPNLLSGISYDNKIPVRQYLADVLARHSLPSVLSDIGYKTQYYNTFFGYSILPFNDEIWSNAKRKSSPKESINEYNRLLQATNFRIMPQIIKERLYQLGSWTTENVTKDWLYSVLQDDEALASPENKDITLLSSNITLCCNKLAPGVNPDVDFVNAMFGRIRVVESSKYFKVFHLQGLHPPRTLDENFKHDLALNEDYDAMPSSGRASLKLIQYIFDELKKADVYDNSVIVVVSDHGAGRTVNPSATEHREELNKKSLRLGFNAVKGTAIPLILVKPSNAKSIMNVSLSPVTLGDLPKTIISLINDNREFPGISMYSRVSDNRERYFWIHSYHESEQDFYGDLQEFIIRGDVYDDSDWSISGNLLRPAKTSINRIQEERDNHLREMLPLKPVTHVGIPFAIPPYGYYDDTFNAARAFDKIQRETGWQPVERPHGKCASQATLGIRYGQPLLLRAYTLKTRFDVEYQAPKSWRLEASNDDHTWVSVDEIMGETHWENGGKIKKYFLDNNEQFYSSYRINILESVGGQCIHIDEFELFE